MALLIAINEGSSSLKISVFERKGNQVGPLILDQSIPFRKDARPSLKKIVRNLDLDPSKIVGIGHRFIHGGPKYTQSVLITPSVVRDLKKFNDLAPLHNPRCLALIEESNKIWPNIPQVAVFDTAFHRTLPSYAREYAIPQKLAKRYHIHKYGFHGISHAYLTQKLIEHTGKNQQKIITLHLGSGCSLAAIRNGVSIETSMGFSPSSGLMMGTRAGDIDSTLFEYLNKKTKKGIKAITHMLNFESGLLGVSENTSDFKQILDRAPKDPNCLLAQEMFYHRILQYIGAYTAILSGVDAIVFSGGIGENSAVLRSHLCEKLSWLGVKISLDKNKQATHLQAGDLHEISSPSSHIKVYVIATYENFLIAQETLRLL